MKSVVSILIPAYNAEKWIADTLRSAVAQTWTRKEIIVVDDGSTDQTVSIVRQFEPYGVKVAVQNNQGAAAARNTAFNLSQGDYIQWLDADDLLSVDKIAIQMAEAEQCNSQRVLLSCGWGRFICRHDKAKFISTPLWCDLSPKEWLLRKMEQNIYMQTATWLVSRELTVTAGPWNTALLGDDDGEYFCRVLLCSSEIRFVPGARVYYRRSGSTSLSFIGKSEAKRDAQWRSMQLHIRHLRSLDDTARARSACVTYMQNCLVGFYPERSDLIRQMQATAHELGGTLRSPQMSWKYSWVKVLFGPHAARQVQNLLSQLKWSLIAFWDRLLFSFTKAFA